MTPEPPGYARPRQVAPIPRPVEAKIAAACPGATVAPWPGGARVHPYWGPWRSIHTGAAKSPAVRFEGSSGGAISALLIHALSTGRVDRVLHVGPDPADPTRNATVISRTAEEILARAGSRYAASSPLESIRDVLAEPGRTAFVGKPCDISALRNLAQLEPSISEKIPLMISFFCGGIPSFAGVERILAALDVKRADVTEFRFRGRGWPGNCTAVTPTGVAEMSYAESWGGHLSKEVQFRCKICPDAVGGVADIACADAWYGDDDGYPSFDEQEGRSLIICRTPAGESLLKSAVGASELDVEPLEVGEIERMQPSQARRKRVIFSRTAALPVSLQPQPKMAGLRIVEAARRASFGEAVRNFLGTLRRTLRGTRSRL
ncbi:Coenzyme F420 hydrogenase/dehydrogenase, beta subunit C-terminal domain [Phenylobacterium sp. SCN 70-31]|uniref:Coenzyme F420 hydrogenase/dehydrogenase, beta subunit C-terminal domain n=1 Tax=Phenylobacterium sp. SCN 70-31 TaxID=1660129 RepID=UPI0025F1F277|nr:Coenzyme F420 hydrogenase/dehydrogenase, beta subunit C-terminal domain [Phenylobacterium sp. SCN 70-31]